MPSSRLSTLSVLADPGSPLFDRFGGATAPAVLISGASAAFFTSAAVGSIAFLLKINEYYALAEYTFEVLVYFGVLGAIVGLIHSPGVWMFLLGLYAVEGVAIRRWYGTRFDEAFARLAYSTVGLPVVGCLGLAALAVEFRYQTPVDFPAYVAVFVGYLLVVHGTALRSAVGQSSDRPGER